MKELTRKAGAFSILVVLSISLLYGCANKTSPIEIASLPQNDIVITQFKQVLQKKPELENPQGTTIGISVTSISSLEAGRIGSNLVIQDLDEAVVVSFGQTGRDRSVSLAVYYDYISVPFRVGAKSEFCSSYNFEIEDNANWQIPIYLDPQIEADTTVHRIIFVFTLGSDEYAKDKDDVSFDSSPTQMYQLHYKTYKENVEYNAIDNQNVDFGQHFPYRNVPFMLNTDISNLNATDYAGLRLSEKHYLVSSSSSFDLNSCITNLEKPVKLALVFLRCGNETAKINGQDYLLIDLNETPMTVSNISLELPSQYGAYDIIGYVVYEPLTPLENGDAAIPKTSNRFTIEIREKYTDYVVDDSLPASSLSANLAR
jgi:hypothetical protein